MTLNFPSSPTLNQIYTSGDFSWSWNGSSWVAVTKQESSAPVYIGSLPPSSPQPGDLWWNSQSGQLFVRYKDPDGEQWVSAITPPPLASLDPDAVVDSLLQRLPEYLDIAAAQADGAPVGSLFKISENGISAIRVVVP